MDRVVDRIIMIAFSVLCAAMVNAGRTIYVFLVGVIVSGLCYYFYNKVLHTILCILLAVIVTAGGSLVFLANILVYETVSDFADGRRKNIIISICAVAAVVLKYVIYYYTDLPYYMEYADYPALPVMGMGIVLAIYMGYFSAGRHKLRQANLRMRDDGEEFRKQILENNKLIREKQDNEIAMATLKERNRIAREIHDNVGHLLSRAIVQMGAVQTINKDEKLAPVLKQVKATLDESMNKIRDSVHGLYNESFDLEKSLNDIISRCEGYVVELNYCMDMGTPLKVKYCVISVVTEALHNVEKHSDATRVIITVAEHPGFYQIIIKDNGTPRHISESGIGLHNMDSRIKELGGNMSINTDKGFGIFCTIPRWQKDL